MLLRILFLVCTLSLLAIWWGLEGAEEEDRSSSENPASAPLIHAAPTVEVEPGLLAPQMDRLTAPVAMTSVHVMDWKEESILQGKMYFCNASLVSRLYLHKGLVKTPDFDWSHVLVDVPNHLPTLVNKKDLERVQGTGIWKMEAPTFHAKIIVPKESLKEVSLFIPHPWVETKGWPKPLQKRYRIPPEFSLPINLEEESVSFTGTLGLPLTVGCRKDYLIETPDGLVGSVEYASGSTNEVLVLRGYPQLTIGVQAKHWVEDGLNCKIKVVLSGDGIFGHEVTGEVHATEYGEWILPYNPGFTRAKVTVSQLQDGLALGRETVELSGLNQKVIIEASQDQALITVLDREGIGIAGVVVVQAKQNLGITDLAGVAQVSINADSGKVWFLSRNYDALGLQPSVLLAYPDVHLAPASGIELQCRSKDDAFALASAGRFEVTGLSYSNVVLEAPQQVQQVYGLSMTSGVSSDFGGGVSLDQAVFRAEPIEPWLQEIWLAGIFEVTVRTEAKLQFSDAYQQLAWSDTVVVLPHQQSSQTILFEELFQTVSVKIVDAQQLPIEKAFVSTGPWAGFDQLSPTDVEGEVSLQVSKTMDFLLIEKAGYVPKRMAWPASQEVIVLRGARDLGIQVLDSTGNRLEVNLELTDGTSRWPGTLKEKGMFEFQAVPQQELQVRVSDGASSVSYTVPPGVKTFTLTHGL